MIIYDLKCDNGHKFEGWFRDRNAFEKQKDRRLISCPMCSSLNTEIVPSSLTVMGRDRKAEGIIDREISPRKALQILNEFIDKNFDDVGPRFAEVAIRMYKGEEEERNIKGTTTKGEEEVLREEGIQFVKIPAPKFDS